MIKKLVYVLFSKIAFRGIELLSPEGVKYHCFLRIGAYICDYEEARDLACVYNQRCYHCDIKQDRLGDYVNGELRIQSDMNYKVNYLLFLNSITFKLFRIFPN
jgi:hypothetical protein